MKSLNSPMEDSLYRRLGGYDVIAAVIDEFLSNFQSDPRLARFGGGRSLDSRRRTRQLIVEQICSLAGGQCVYTGRDMKTSHAGLGITEGEWQATLEHASAALETCGAAPKEKVEFLAIFRRYKDDIVEKS
jgi:hemoglobin